MAERTSVKAIIARIPPEWGKFVSHGDGWNQLVTQLDEALAKIDPDYEVHQCKEKYGGLRYYCSLDDTPSAVRLIDEAESQSYEICESCGKNGYMHVRGGWYRTLCTDCAHRDEFIPASAT